MTLKAKPKPSKPSKPRLIKKAATAKETPSRWRDVTLYFNTLDAETYGLKTLAKQVRAHLKPTDVFERIWCDDIIALCWQAHQLRRIKGYIVFEGAREVVAEKLKIADQVDPREERYNNPAYEASAALYVTTDPGVTEAERKLERAGVAVDRRFDMGYVARAYELENIDRLIFANEKRRDDLIDRFESRRG